MRMKTMWVVTLAAALLAFGACSSESGESGAGQTDTAGTDTPATAQCGCGDAVCGVDDCGNSCGECGGTDLCLGGQCVVEATCNAAHGFSPAREAVFQRLTGGVSRVRYEGTQGKAEPPFEKVIIELVDGRAPTQPGIYDLAEQGGPDECGICVTARRTCNETDCFNTFDAVAGQVELKEMGQPGGKLVATLRGARFKQVEPVAKDDFWCIDRLDIAQDVPERNTKNFCVENGTGRNVGDNIANIKLTNCAGEEVHLHDLCGQAKAVWFIASAGWCGACESFVPVAYDKYKELENDGLQLYVMLGEDGSTNKPSQKYCEDYADRKGMDRSVVFIDNSEGISWNALFGAINNYANGGIGLPWSVILDGDSMEYMWSNTAGADDLYTTIDNVLAD